MITPLQRKHASQIAKIHILTLADDFLPSLGINFLTALYEGVIGKEGVLGFVDFDKKKIRGFVIGTKNMTVFFKQALRENFLKLLYYLLVSLFQKPYLIKKVFETFLYPKKEIGPKAELIVIVVLKKWQGQGIGKRLIRSLERAFLQNNIKKYKLTVHTDKKAISFYEKLNYRRISSFNLYDKMWYVYEKKLL